MILIKSKFIDLLNIILESIEKDDSMEGTLTYSFGEKKDTYEVNAFIRVGNSMGQGGCILIGASDANKTDKP